MANNNTRKKKNNKKKTNNIKKTPNNNKTKTTKNTPQNKTKPSQKKTTNKKITNTIIYNDELKNKDKTPNINISKSKKYNNKLKEYDLNKYPKNKKKKIWKSIWTKIELIFEILVFIISFLLYIILYPLKLLVLALCKVIKKIPKTIKKFKLKQYNRDRNKKKKNNSAIIPNQKKKEKTKNNVINDSDELILLHYRDYKGLKKITVFFKNRLRVINFDMKRFKKKFKYGTLKDKLLIIFMLGLIFVFSLIVVFCIYVVINAPEVTAERLYLNNASILYDKNGNEFARLGRERREKVTYDQIPDVLVDAIVATEDSRFFQHEGIDIARFAKASLGQLLGQRDAGGGSTLTMQVSKKAATTSERHGIAGIIRKFTDIYLSVFVIEKKYTKEEIMEFYVNINYLGSYSYGVQQASENYFGKKVSDLNLVEAATIAGLFQAPYSYDPFLHPVACEKRRNTVLNLMYRHGYITESERDAAQAIPVKSTLANQKSSKNQYQDFIDTIIEDVIARTKELGYGEGLDPTTTPMKIYTTLDPEKQKVIDDVMSGETYEWKNDTVQGGIVLMDVKTGAIVAVGASRDPSERVYNYATTIKRHPGSTAKPIIDYGPAFEYLNWSTGNTVIDDEISYTGGKGNIRNFDKKFKGIMTVKTGLAQSRNVPALLAFRQTTHEQKLGFARNLGWEPLTDGNGHIFETCAIGGYDGVNPRQSVAAYAAFARGGTYITPYTYTKIELDESGTIIEPEIKKVNAMSESTAYLVNNILQYAVNSGTIRAARVKGTEVAAKTGTSTVDTASAEAAGIKGQIIGDSWLNAYTSDYAFSLWYGYREQINPDAYLTSTEGSAERKAITRILAPKLLNTGAKFDVPSDIVTAEVELETDPLELASPYTPEDLRSVELFKKGSVPENVSTRFAQLTNPSDLKYTSNDASVTLTWTAAPTPDAVNQEYLRNYFTNSPIYSTWVDKYLQRRLQYNEGVLGAFGYEIYMINETGTIDLGFTTNTTFSTNVKFSSSTKFMVKSSYQKFKSNQSPGIYVSVSPNSQTNTGTTQAPTNNLAIQYNGETCSSKMIDFLNGDYKSKITVTSNGQDVTSKSIISSPVCRDDDGNEISCSTIQSGRKYTVTFTIRYNGINRNKQITVSPTC